MRITPTALPDVKLIEPEVFEDPRGAFAVTFNDGVFASSGLPSVFVQHNYSRSGQGVLRGLHYQIRHAQGKLVQVVRGEIFDVVADIRRSSPHFGTWAGQTLTADRPRLLWVPPGFAHGFYVLSETADIIYYVTDRYSREDERTILWNDPSLSIEWPILPDTQPVLSDKDLRASTLSGADVYE